MKLICFAEIEGLTSCKPGYPGWYLRSSTNHCYYISSTAAPWRTAKERCKDLDPSGRSGRLVGLETLSEFNWLVSHINERNKGGKNEKI